MRKFPNVSNWALFDCRILVHSCPCARGELCCVILAAACVFLGGLRASPLTWTRMKPVWVIERTKGQKPTARQMHHRRTSDSHTIILKPRCNDPICATQPNLVQTGISPNSTTRRSPKYCTRVQRPRCRTYQDIPHILSRLLTGKSELCMYTDALI